MTRCDEEEPRGDGHYPDRSTAAERARWEERWSALVDRELPPSRWLVEQAGHLPMAGRALDWAGGDGRNALWLAERGLEVTLADIAPTALATATRRAQERGLTLHTVAVDLALEPPPAGPWDLIICHHYHDPAFVTRARPLLAPGGVLVVNHPTVRNLERHPRPPAHFLYEEGALRALVEGVRQPGDTIVVDEEGWAISGRHEAGLILRAAGVAE